MKDHKLVNKCVTWRTNEKKSAPNIIKAVDILKVTGWVKSALKKVTSDDIKHSSKNVASLMKIM